MNIEPVRRALDAIGARYALIGAHAMAARGYPRFTVDIDLLTSDVRVLNEVTWTSVAQAGAQVDRRRGDHEDPLAGVVHILLPDETDIDIVLAKWQWQADVIARAESLTVAEGVTIPVPQMSDLILLKLSAGGFMDLQDAAALLAIGDRDAVIRDVEGRINDLRPDVRSVWRELLERHV